MLASDMNNPNFTGAQNPNDLLNVTFDVRPIKDNFRSTQEGRDVFNDVTYIKIMTPGNNHNIIERPVRPQDKINFIRQWMAFESQNVNKGPSFGTPVDKWVEINPARAEELKYLKFMTVEQIANASDHQLQAIGMDGNMLKQKAQAFINGSLTVATNLKKDEEIAKRDKQISELMENMAKMSAMMAEMQARNDSEPKAKRKYTKRQKEETKPEATE